MLEYRKNFNFAPLSKCYPAHRSHSSHSLFLYCRCFDVGNGNHVLSTINLSNSHKPSKSHRNFALAYGEVAVSFSIAPPVSGRNEITMYPIFVLQENGDVLIVWSWLHKKR